MILAVLEDSGYLARAAFLLDRYLSRLGLSGVTLFPLLSSFACAIPGIMATRVIKDPRERLITILIAPLMSCSARLPVYVLLIAAFVPALVCMPINSATLTLVSRLIMDDPHDIIDAHELMTFDTCLRLLTGHQGGPLFSRIWPSRVLFRRPKFLRSWAPVPRLDAVPTDDARQPVNVPIDNFVKLPKVN